MAQEAFWDYVKRLCREEVYQKVCILERLQLIATVETGDSNYGKSKPCYTFSGNISPPQTDKHGHYLGTDPSYQKSIGSGEPLRIGAGFGGSWKTGAISNE